MSLLAVPPVLPLIHRNLGLTEASAAALAGLPLLMFGLAAVPGAYAIVRLGRTARGAGGSHPHRAFGRGARARPVEHRSIRWKELERITAKKDPTSVTIQEMDNPRVTEGEEYRVCAVVPALGDNGTVCAAPVGLTESPFLQDPIHRTLPTVPLHP